MAGSPRLHLPPIMPREDDGALSAPWGEHSIPRDDVLTVRVGPLTLWARGEGDEIRLAHASGHWMRPEPGAGDAPPPDDRDWVRWPVGEGVGRLVLSPALPPRTVVVEPELSFRLPPGGRARIFVRVPLWARVRVAGPGGATLTEVPSVVLSDTWWGGFTEGELCYWLPTSARRRVSPEVFTPNVAVCPLQLSNRSGGELAVERIALRVAHLSLFSDEGRLWADETRVRYRGVEEGSEIDFAGGRPEEAPGAVPVAPPRRSPPARGLRARTFARLRALSGLGGSE